jgi:hypothetical protein
MRGREQGLVLTSSSLKLQVAVLQLGDKPVGVLTFLHFEEKSTPRAVLFHLESGFAHSWAPFSASPDLGASILRTRV